MATREDFLKAKPDEESFTLSPRARLLQDCSLLRQTIILERGYFKDNKISLYVDMDDTLFDFRGQMDKRKVDPEAYVCEDKFTKFMINGEYDKRFFASLELTAFGKFFKENLSTFEEFFNDISILTYVGNHSKIDMVINEKMESLHRVGFSHLKFIPVAHDKLKKIKFCSSRNDVIIDDDSAIIKQWPGKSFHPDDFKQNINHNIIRII